MTTTKPMHYDFIGDIHGCHDTLVSLLRALEYRLIDGCYRHPSRKTVFVGDFVDRGPHQIQVIDTVRAMVDAGQAHAVMGNHEFNAIAYVTEDKKYGGYLRSHSERNERNHRAFLDAMEAQPERYDDVLEWFKTLPLWLDLGNVRVVHACWDRDGIAQLQAKYSSNGLMTDELLHAASDPKNPEFEIVENLLKGKTIKLADGLSYEDSVGITRHYMRVRWWDIEATTYKAAFIGPPAALSHIEDDPIDGDHLIEYGRNEVPLFIGHYWMQGVPKPLSPNIACVDYSIARRETGKLCAYRWDGEAELDMDKFICVPRLEP